MEQALQGENAKGLPHRYAETRGKRLEKVPAVECRAGSSPSRIRWRRTEATWSAILTRWIWERSMILPGRASRAALCDGMVTVSSAVKC